MIALDRIAEERIAAAIERGELSDLPGQGTPLILDDDALIPETLRMAYRILRNAGLVPPEVETLRAIRDLERVIEDLSEPEPRSRALRKLQLLRLRLETSGRPGNMMHAGSYYSRKLLGHFDENGRHKRRPDDCRAGDGGHGGGHSATTKALDDAEWSCMDGEVGKHNDVSRR